jgi:hypothetical protein
MKVLVYILMAGATVAAVAIARRRREHWSIALVLLGVLGSHLLRLAIAPHIHRPPDGAPLTGAARSFGHIAQALYLVDPLAIAGGSVCVFLGRRPWPLLAAWAALTLGLVLSYPLSRGAVLRQVYLVVELGALVVAIGAAAMWARRWQPLETHHRAMAFIIGTDFVIVVFGPWRYPLGVRWDLALTAELILFATLILYQVGVLWRKPSP